MKSNPEKTKSRPPLTGPEKAAILLALVGEELAAALAGELQEKELVMLRQGVHRMAQIGPEDIDEVFEDACRFLKKANIFAEGTSDYLQRVITKAMGPEKASAILSRIFQEETDESYGIDALHEMDGKMLAQFLQAEHPQTTAFILAHLYPAHAGEVFTLLSEDKQAEVAYRITRLGSTSPGAIEEVSKVLRNEIRQVQGKQVGGVRPIAEILNFVDNATEERVMTGLNEFEPALADSIRELMFTFEDLGKIDDQSMQVLIREVEKDKWVMALRTASPNLKKKVFGNMSERAGALLKEEIESMGPVRFARRRGRAA
jgi:flagellar motor switch protein FliG